MPFLYANFIDVLSKALSKNIEIEIILPRNISLKIKKCINSSKKNLKLIETHEDIEFSLFLSATNMAFGLFKDDGYYDQNRLLIANDENSLIWAENLFENFKKEN
ncbi:MAG: DUF1724 domain-containing protein [Methanobacteriaceae archaeon]|nr:DUF1724 domain-containing protein [Methanobacteriaceae archaeon]